MRFVAFAGNSGQSYVKHPVNAALAIRFTHTNQFYPKPNTDETSLLQPENLLRDLVATQYSEVAYLLPIPCLRGSLESSFLFLYYELLPTSSGI